MNSLSKINNRSRNVGAFLLTLLLASTNASADTPTLVVTVADARAEGNKSNILEFYELMLSRKRPMEAAAKYLSNNYVQHNPLLPDGAEALGKNFGALVMAHPNARVTVHKIIAVGDYVWAHVNFFNLYNDDADDRGIAGVDTYRMDESGKATEHWDVLQQVPDPKTSPNSNGTVTDARIERILRRAEWPLRRSGGPKMLGSTPAVAGYLEVAAA